MELTVKEFACWSFCCSARTVLQSGRAVARGLADVSRCGDQRGGRVYQLSAEEAAAADENGDVGASVIETVRGEGYG